MIYIDGAACNEQEERIFAMAFTAAAAKVSDRDMQVIQRAVSGSPVSKHIELDAADIVAQLTGTAALAVRCWRLAKLDASVSCLRL